MGAIKIKTPRTRGRLKVNPAQVLVLGFLSLIFLGTLLLSLPIASKDAQSIGVVDALFTSTSSVCLTGLVVADTYSQFTIFGQVVIMLLVQMGGLGIMTMATLIFIILGKRITLRDRLIMQEALNQDSLSGLVKLTWHIFFITLAFEIIGAILLSLRFVPIYGTSRGIYYGIFHSISAFNNAGFALFGGYQSLTDFVLDPVVNLVIMALVVFGGLGFTVIYDILVHKSFKRLSLHSKVVLTVTGGLLILGFLVFLFLEFDNPKSLRNLSPLGKALAASFFSVNTRTAGFSTIDVSDMTRATQFFMLFLMFVGASPASTGSGVKTTTFAALVMMIYSVISFKGDVEIFERRIPKDVYFKAVAIVVVSALLIFTTTFFLTITEEMETFSLLFEAVAAFGTGLTLGVTEKLSTAGKLILCVTMFAGRLGPLTLVLALNNRKKRSLTKFPEEHLLVG